MAYFVTATHTWVRRIHGVRANASAKSLAELDESDTLDIGDIADLSCRYRALLRRSRRYAYLADAAEQTTGT